MLNYPHIHRRFPLRRRIALLVGICAFLCAATTQAGGLRLSAGVQAGGFSARSGSSPQLAYTAQIDWTFDNRINLGVHTTQGHRPWNDETNYLGNVMASIGYLVWKGLTVYGGIGPVWHTVVLQPWYRYTNYGAALNIGVQWSLPLWGPLYALPQVDVTGLLMGGEMYFQYTGGIGLALVFSL